MINLKSSAGLKLIVIFAIGFFLWIGTFFVGAIINERLERSREVSREIGEKWGGGQTVTGPVITVSYLTGDETRVRYVHLLPDSIRITADMSPEIRKRSIYSTVLYSGNLRFVGSFDFASLRQVYPDEDWQHGSVVLNFGLTDIIGLSEGISLKLNGEQQEVFSGVINSDILPGGFHSRPDTDGDHGDRIDFDIEFGLQGNRNLSFIPTGKITEVDLSAGWPNPSFQGAFLPRQSEVTAEDLISTVDHYQKSERTVKYALMFIGLTFIGFFLVEVMNRVQLHPINYLLIGLNLILFYVLLLAISEHLTFNSAYIIASVSLVALISVYASAVLKSLKLGTMMAGVLLFLYTFLFVILQLEDYALLVGSLALFILLAVIMILTRHIDWYTVFEKKESGE
ncbi:MAG: cell envelope integrity protein CreD [Rhodothermaceae bacterium]|nr:cell envelope integrity protein CreD [Rhodothermaceae bacterium]